jgi:hypothetical protein
MYMWSALRVPTEAKQQRHAVPIILGQGGGEVDVIELHLQGRCQGDVVDDLMLDRQVDWHVPTCVVPVDTAWPSAAVQICMDQSEAEEADQFNLIREAQVMTAHAGEGNLKQFAHRADLHHRPDREIPVDVIVEIETKGENGTIGRAPGEAEVRAESPLVVVRACPKGVDQPGTDYSIDQDSGLYLA